MDEPRGDERRKAGRLRTAEVTCSIGKVLGMSATGMKVLRQGRRVVSEGDQFTLTLKYRHFALPVDVRVVRILKRGFRKYEFGIAFEEVNPRIQSKLTDLARLASDQLVIASA